MVRILKVEWLNRNDFEPIFVPQYINNEGKWMDYFGYDDNSPYIHNKTFSTPELAIEFAKNPSIFSPGETDFHGTKENTLIRKVTEVSLIED